MKLTDATLIINKRIAIYPISIILAKNPSFLFFTIVRIITTASTTTPTIVKPFTKFSPDSDSIKLPDVNLYVIGNSSLLSITCVTKQSL